MLVRLGKVTEQDIKLTFAAFRKLDGHNDGVLNSRSIIAGMIQRRKSLSHEFEPNGGSTTNYTGSDGAVTTTRCTVYPNA